MSLAIIIPTLNEEKLLPEMLGSLKSLSPEPDEIILVDGGSGDRTIEIARTFGLRILEAERPGRAGQMNLGASAVSSDTLCFLHADTFLPSDFVTITETVLSDRRTVLAGFVSLMGRKGRTRWFTSFHNYIKTFYAPLLFRPISFLRGGRLLFGDQVMICRTQDFRAVGGFDSNQEIMEEADLCLRMVRAGLGRIRQVHRVVRSSDRRVAEWGSLKANLRYIYIGALWGLGASSERLARSYRDVR